MIMNSEFVLDNLPVRLSHQNKGDFGHVLVIGGSVGMCGSVCMTAMAATRSGAGLVTVAVPDEIAPIVSVKLTESMVLPLPSENGTLCIKSVDAVRKFLSKVNTVVIGMGGRACDGICAVLEMLLTEFTGTLIVDADGLNVLSRNRDLLDIPRRCGLVLTPHPGEMARLLSFSVSEVQKKREETAKNYSSEHQCVLVLKGEKTVITNGRELCVNPTGNPGMATGGSGDVLAGIISGLAAQGMNAFNSSACGCYLHGLAGDIAVKEKTEYGLIATDLIEYLPKAFLAL